MKKLRKLNLKSASELNAEQMKTIKGGNIQYFCFCGEAGAPTSSIVPINAPDYPTAHQIMEIICGGPAVCFTPYTE